MNSEGNRKEYGGIDIFRMAAAVLVIAVHTSPLLSCDETLDFILSRIIARLAVPFFFTASGFFVIKKYRENADWLKSFVKKTLLIYLAAMAFYLPLNIYKGDFAGGIKLPEIIKDLVFDGTFYHLWYLPAAALGAGIAWFLVSKGYKKAFAVSGLLYLAGLLGDSYYGLVGTIPPIKAFYDIFFQIADYTRCGIFFAPVFFVIGSFLAEKEDERKTRGAAEGAFAARHAEGARGAADGTFAARHAGGARGAACGTFAARKNTFCFLIFFSAMLIEGLTLHFLNLQRHDSMYVFLPFCVYFLFRIAISVKIKARKAYRPLSLLIYIIHPWMIVVTRFIAKLLNLKEILVENSLINFVSVLLLSILGSAVAYFFIKRIRPKKKGTPPVPRAFVEINTENLAHNVRVLKAAMPEGSEFTAVVKANAYGHGAFAVVKTLSLMGVKSFATAEIDEAKALRRYGVTGEILILGHTPPERAKELKKYRLTQTLIDSDYAKRLDAQGVKLNAHIKIDSGMHRLGFPVKNEKEIEEAFALKNIKITGMFSHLCVADSFEESDVAFTKEQLKAFQDLTKRLEEKGIALPKLHMQSSYGFLNYSGLKYDFVRFGISLYGLESSASCKDSLKPDLRPVMSLKSKIVLLRKIKKGETAGYGRSFKAERDSVLAILPIGYADGYPRELSFTKSYVLIRGKKAPVAGKICMDQTAVDVTDIPEAEIGDIAVLAGRSGDEEITYTDLADKIGTIANDLLCRGGTRLKRIIK